MFLAHHEDDRLHDIKDQLGVSFAYAVTAPIRLVTGGESNMRIMDAFLGKLSGSTQRVEGTGFDLYSIGASRERAVEMLVAGLLADRAAEVLKGGA